MFVDTASQFFSGAQWAKNLKSRSNATREWFPHTAYKIKYTKGSKNDDSVPSITILSPDSGIMCKAYISNYDIDFFNSYGIIPIAIFPQNLNKTGHSLLLVRQKNSGGDTKQCYIIDPHGINYLERKGNVGDNIILSIQNGLLAALGEDLHIRFKNVQKGLQRKQLQCDEIAKSFKIIQSQHLDLNQAALKILTTDLQAVKDFVEKDPTGGFCHAWSLFRMVDILWAHGACSEFILRDDISATSKLRMEVVGSWECFSKERLQNANTGFAVKQEWKDFCLQVRDKSYDVMILPIFTRLVASFFVNISHEIDKLRKKRPKDLINAFHEESPLVTKCKTKWKQCSNRPWEIMTLMMTDFTNNSFNKPTVKEVCESLDNPQKYPEITSLSARHFLFGKKRQFDGTQSSDIIDTYEMSMSDPNYKIKIQ